MTLTADERERFLASLRTDAPFREQVRRELLSEQLLGLPDRFASFVEEMHSFVEEMHSFVEAANKRFDALDRDVGRLKDDSGKLRGMVLEAKMWNNPGYYLLGHARRVQAVGLDELLDQLGIADLSDDEYAALGRTDMLATGLSRDDGSPLVMVVEATWRVHSGDVDRLVARRQILAVRGVRAVAVIAATEPPSDPVRHYAAVNGVAVDVAEAAGAA